MIEYTWLFAALFLPLFPLSAVFVLVHRKLPSPWVRGLLFIVWPQVGVLLLTLGNPKVPGWLMWWAAATALLYALRALVIREVGLWLGYIGVSSWSLLWIIIATDKQLVPGLVALGLSLPLVLMTLLARELQRRFATCYSGLTGGFVPTQPRLATLLVIGTLAATATPLFPGFFTLVSAVIAQVSAAPAFAPALLLVWLLWTWSGIRLLQGLVMGPIKPATREIPDLGAVSTGLYAAVLLAMLWFGFQFTGSF